MQVNLSFDTEKDSAEDFRKLLDYVKNILAEKEGQSAPASSPQVASAPQRTAGGCKVVPYQDLSDELFSLCSKKRR